MFPTPTFPKGAISKFALLLGLAVGACSLGLKPAHALAPAGSTINNQASGVYSDASGLPLTVTSNAVQTVVQPVAAFNLAADGTKNATAGSTVNFPHTLTNTGNAPDVFNLSVADLGGDDFNILPVLRADANGDGVPDGLLPITRTVTLAPGESFQFVVSGTVLSTGLGGNTARVQLTGTSQFDPSITANNTDTVNLTTNAQITVVKSIDRPSGAPGSGPYTYTLTYSNAGNTAATNLAITDVLPLGVTYAPDSGRWSNSGAAPLGDGPGADPAGINYDYTVAGRVVAAQVATVAPGASGQISFSVNVNAGILPQILPNVALYTYNDGLNIIGLSPTNTVNLAITQIGGVTFTGATVPSANQGGAVVFPNVLTNTGSGPDSFDIAVGLGNFPLGTTFQLLQNDGVTPLQDTNGNGIPDTGSVAPGATYTVNLRANLATTTLLGGPYSVTKTAVSRINPLVNATVTDTLTAITGNTVDLTNDLAGTLGAGPGPEASPVTTLVGAAGTTQRFSLFVKNTSAVADSFALLASASTDFSAGLNLPAGFGLSFKTDAGAILTNTGLIQPGATLKINADVFIPTGAVPQTVNLFFRVLSPLTGALDTKIDAVRVGGLRSIALAPNSIGQVYPGNAVVFTHTLTNTGNLPEGDGILSSIALATDNSQTGFTSVVYRDANGDGVLDASDPIVTNLNGNPLLPGQSATLFVKVYAPAGTDLGTINATTLTATATGGVGPAPVAVVKDSTTVIAGQIRMEKTQALDTGGTLVYSVSRITTGAKPGAIIRYRIVATNVGTAPALGFIISDAIPAFTVYDDGDGSLSATGNAVWFDGTTYFPAVTPLADGATGTLNFNVGTLNPGQSAVVTFGVRIQ